MQSTHIVNKGTCGVLDVFGPTLEFLILPEDVDGAYCVMTGTIPQVFQRLFTAILILRVFFWSREPFGHCLNEMGSSNGWT